MNIELPSALLKAANLEGRNLYREAARLLAFELYREEKAWLAHAAHGQPTGRPLLSPVVGEVGTGPTDPTKYYQPVL